MTTVYILQTGCYEGRDIAGVFDTAERAMGTRPDDKWKLTYWNHGGRYWTNDKDWERAAEIYEWDVTATGAERLPDAIIQQQLAADGKTWDYVPITADEGRALP